jgi:hypothetical protein
MEVEEGGPLLDLEELRTACVAAIAEVTAAALASPAL